MSLLNDFLIKNTDFKKVKILCVGDVILDRFISGNVDRVSPEAPIPVLNSKTQKDILGGAGNVIANISSLGASAEIVSCIGNDQEGSIIKKLIDDLANTKGRLFVDKKRVSTTKERYVSGSQHLLRVDKEDKKEIEKSLEKKIKTLINKSINAFALRSRIRYCNS